MQKNYLKNIKMVINFFDDVPCLYVLKRVEVKHHVLLNSALNVLVCQSHVSPDILTHKEPKYLKGCT